MSEVEHVYMNMDELDRKPSRRFSRSWQLSYCNAFLFGVFALAMFGVRRFGIRQSSLGAKWRLLFYCFWPLVLVSVSTVLGLNIKTPKWVNATHLFMMLTFGAGTVGLMLTFVGNFVGFALRFVAMSMVLYGAWKWWKSFDISHFDSPVLFYINKNVSAFALGWFHVNFCLVVYSVLPFKIGKFGSVASSVYFLLLLGGLAVSARKVYASERVFGLKSFVGFLLAALYGGIVFFFAQPKLKK